MERRSVGVLAFFHGEGLNGLPGEDQPSIVNRGCLRRGFACEGYPNFQS